MKKVINKEKDFTIDDLPKNRIEVFFDVIKLHYRELLLLAFIFALSLLPLIGFSIIIDFFNYNKYNEYINGSIDNESYRQGINFISLIFNIFIGLFVEIVLIFLGGIFRIIKRLCYLQPVFFKSDFFKGIKQNIKLYLLIGVLFSFINFIDTFLIKTYSDNFLSYIPLGMSLLILYPVLIISLIISSAYNVTFYQMTINAFKIYFRGFIIFLPICLLFMSPSLFYLIDDIVLKHLLLITFSIIYPLIFLLLFLYTSSVLDKYINKINFPELYDRGIHRKGAKK